MELTQLDVKTAFLSGDLDKEMYMEQSQGLASSNQEHLVYRLQKSFYGLKQAPWQWYRMFDDYIYSQSVFSGAMRTTTCTIEFIV